MADRRVVTGEVQRIEMRTAKGFDWRAIDKPLGISEREVYVLAVERFDEEGNVTSPVAAEISTKNGFTGLLSEGDQVTFFADKQVASGAFKVDALRNLTTGTIFGSRRAVKRGDVPAQ